jgi:nitrite reductase (NADH) large subunit
MYGGLTSAAQLRRIADVIDKYSIPLIKLSAAARLDLLGVTPSEVNSVTAELNMPVTIQSYGKPVMSVITCEGSSYDANAMQDSIRIGAALERRLEHLQIPTDITIAVSGSPLHRSGTLIKDIGIVGTPGGWEIYVGGSGNTQVRQGQLLCTEETEEAALNKVSAFIQWYREDAYYGEMTGQWLDRTGIVQLREGLFNHPHRIGLLERLEVESEAIFQELQKSWPTAALIR